MRGWRSTIRASLAGLVLLAAQALPALAVRPDEMMSDPGQEARARAVSAELRCLVCQNESIDDSDADLAHDIRVLVRERIAAGDSDQQVVDFMVARYGDFVLLRPRLEWRTLLLWGTPFILLVAGGLAIGLGYRRRRTAAEPPLSMEEQAELDRVLAAGR